MCFALLLSCCVVAQIYRACLLPWYQVTAFITPSGRLGVSKLKSFGYGGVSKLENWALWEGACVLAMFSNENIIS